MGSWERRVLALSRGCSLWGLVFKETSLIYTFESKLYFKKCSGQSH